MIKRSFYGTGHGTFEFYSDEAERGNKRGRCEKPMVQQSGDGIVTVSRIVIYLFVIDVSCTEDEITPRTTQQFC